MESTVEPRWRKSSYSGNGGSDCVEVVRNLPGTVAVRDSKDAGGPVLVFPAAGWQGFTASQFADSAGGASPQHLVREVVCPGQLAVRSLRQ